MSKEVVEIQNNLLPDGELILPLVNYSMANKMVEIQHILLPEGQLVLPLVELLHSQVLAPDVLHLKLGIIQRPSDYKLLITNMVYMYTLGANGDQKYNQQIQL